MSASSGKAWVEATQLDSEGQAFMTEDAVQLLVPTLQKALITLDRIVSAPSGLGFALDVQKSLGLGNWEDVASMSVENEELVVTSGTYRVRCHIFGGQPNAQGEFYGEGTFTWASLEEPS